MREMLGDHKGRLIALALVAVLLPIGGALAVATEVNSGVPSASSAPPSAPGAPSHPSVFYATPIHHVVLVLLENTEASTVLSGSPFEIGLANTYAYLNQSYGVCHPSEPNYLALITGLQTQCETDNYAILGQYNLADALDYNGLTWREYAESMPTPCSTTDTGLYAVRHNPFVFMQDIVQNTSRCNSHVVDFNAWASDVKSGNIPNFAFITPNLNDDGHNTQSSYADAWLQGWLTPLLSTPWAASTAFIITYDEGLTGAGYSQDGISLWGGHVYTVIVSPFSKGIGLINTPFSHFNTLTTIEWLFGLGSFSSYDDFIGFPPAYAAFHFPDPTAPVGSPGALSGAVTGNGARSLRVA